MIYALIIFSLVVVGVIAWAAAVIANTGPRTLEAAAALIRETKRKGHR